MTEFELATLALQQGQLWAAVAIPAVGLVQSGLIAWGLRLMGQANRARAAEGQRLERAADQRHAENIEALRGLERAADQRHAENMEALQRLERAADQRHAENMEALRGLVASLERQGAALEAAFKGGRA